MPLKIEEHKERYATERCLQIKVGEHQIGQASLETSFPYVLITFLRFHLKYIPEGQ